MPNLIQCILQNHADLEHAALSLYEEWAQHVVADAAETHVSPISKALYAP